MIETSYPLSPMQQGMLFQHLAGADSGVNIEQIVCSLPEDLDIPALEKAWQRVAQRHAVLRTSFGWDVSGQPLQTVHGEPAVSLTQEDWSSSSAKEQGSRWSDYLEADRRKGFDPEKLPLWRLTLIRLGRSEYRLLWTLHHILLDGRSFPLVLQEAFALYDAFCRGAELTLAPAPPYQDHIAWLQRQPLAPAEEFWKAELAGFASPTSIPLGERPSLESEPYGHQELRLSAEFTAHLGSVCRERGFSLNGCVQGAWSILLGRYSGEEDVVFGVARAGRKSSVPGSETVVGMFMNVLPLRARLTRERPVAAWLKDLSAGQHAVREHEHIPLASVQALSEVAPGTLLFQSILVFDYGSLDSQMHSDGARWKDRRFELIERTGFPITLYVYAGKELDIRVCFDSARFERGAMGRMLRHLQVLLEGIASNPDCPLADLSILTETDRRRLLVDWNPPVAAATESNCIHELFEKQAARTPDSIALACGGEQLTYFELNGRANQLARVLRARGVGPEIFVGVLLERSVDLVVGLLAILKAGGAYVPLDPAFPEERLAFMLRDAEARVVLTQDDLVSRMRDFGGTVVCTGRDRDEIGRETGDNFASGATPENLAYVIYTSGSTGQPKGVMVEHRNVAGMFDAMDPCMRVEPPGAWLAVTTVSFDISVLELFWTLTRGYRLVLQTETDNGGSGPPSAANDTGREIALSLFYFATDETGSATDEYRLLLEGAKFADQHGFEAVWTPERHFYAFGGLYPNPAVASAALAAITERIQIRAGSVVLPLHDPIRVAEEWALVDNLSNGRVGISFASGWHADDFVLAPEKYADRKAVMMRDIETVRQLWRGEAIARRGGTGQTVEVRILPRPVQPDLPVWVTAAGSPETFRLAAKARANVLTHLLGQSLEDLAAKIAVYRTAWREAGHEPDGGRVTLMLHTFVGDDLEAVREKVRKPFSAYLKSSVDLVKKSASSFPASQKVSQEAGAALAELPSESVDALLSHAFDRYFETSGLFGTAEHCARMVGRLKAIGVDEVACLIDFGVDFDSVMESLEKLDRVRRMAQETGAGPTVGIPEQMRRHGVTHLQCTPSLARLLVADPETLESLQPVRRLLIGGEAFPGVLAEQLVGVVAGEVRNMYGPTETTIWSTSHAVQGGPPTVPIGRPLANSEVFILGRDLDLVPIGVPGEICIGGAGVVRGYWRRPDLQADRFIAHPFRREPGARLYRTGDLGRYSSDGTIEFLGRLDQQVKIRGHRVELGEIEAVLGRHPAVREAAVIVTDGSPEDSRVVAYVVAHDHDQPSADELRSFLETKLPEYMIPQVYVALDALPRTPNGKVNRKALPEPDPTRRKVGEAFVAPRTRVEETLTEIWTAVLAVDRIGVYDNFFNLGGHSLSAVSITFRVRQAFGVTLPLQTFLRAPTIARLAEKLEEILLAQVESRELDRLLDEVEGLSDEETRSLIREHSNTRPATGAEEP